MVAIALLAGPGGARAGAPAGVVTTDADPAGVRSYWTPERMREADPAPVPTEGAGRGPIAVRGEASSDPVFRGATGPGAGPVAQSGSTLGSDPQAQAAEAPVRRSEVSDPASEPYRAHGKIFFTVNGGDKPGDYLCSGTAVSANNRSVVWTAGHCVFDTLGGGFVDNFVFVPGYKDDAAPFGEWPATDLATSKKWKRRGSFKADFGAATVDRNGQGQSLGEVVGGRGIAFGQPRAQDYEALGYPAVGPPAEFTGERMFRCLSPLVGTDNPGGRGPETMSIACDMAAGSSGGGWVVNDTVLSVSSYIYERDDARLYGPYQGGIAEKLYNSAAGKPARCGGKLVTYLGTADADKIIGTRGRDVIKTLGGEDVIKGRGGRDVICSGGGADTLKGNAGKDKLKGGGGDDVLRGGRKRDRCDGGRGDDDGRSCEKRKRL